MDDDFLKWKRYFRGGLIQSQNNELGVGTYVRLKRSTKFTFKDLVCDMVESDLELITNNS